MAKRSKRRRLPALLLLTLLCLSVGLRAERLKSVRAVKNVVGPERPTIIVDAGHGGFDGGAVAPDGGMEKDINLAVARQLEVALLLRGYEVVMTRSDDTALQHEGRTGKTADMTARLAILREHPGGVLLSIHANKFSVSKYCGAQVFYPKGDAVSKLLAQKIQESIASGLQPDNTRTIKAAGGEIFLLSKAEIPAVLVECGFLSNPGELLLLRSEAYQKSLADCIASAVDLYYNGEKNGV